MCSSDLGVYGIVALIVRMDDAGYRLMQKSGNKGFLNTLGEILVKALPIVIKSLAVIGTIALLLVSGGIFDHNIKFLHDLLPNWNEMLKQILFGTIAGLMMVPLFSVGKKLIAAVRN